MDFGERRPVDEELPPELRTLILSEASRAALQERRDCALQTSSLIDKLQRQGMVTNVADQADFGRGSAGFTEAGRPSSARRPGICSNATAEGLLSAPRTGRTRLGRTGARSGILRGEHRPVLNLRERLEHRRAARHVFDHVSMRDRGQEVDVHLGQVGRGRRPGRCTPVRVPPHAATAYCADAAQIDDRDANADLEQPYEVAQQIEIFAGCNRNVEVLGDLGQSRDVGVFDRVFSQAIPASCSMRPARVAWLTSHFWAASTRILTSGPSNTCAAYCFRNAVTARPMCSRPGTLAGVLASSNVRAVAKATALVTCPLGKGSPQEVRPMRGLSTNSVRAVARGTDTVTIAAAIYRRRRIHASTKATAIAVTGTGSPAQTSADSSAGCPPRLARTLASTSVSTQPVSIPCLSHTPCTASTSAQTTTIVTDRGRVAAGSSGPAADGPVTFNACPSPTHWSG